MGDFLIIQNTHALCTHCLLLLLIILTRRNATDSMLLELMYSFVVVAHRRLEFYVSWFMLFHRNCHATESTTKNSQLLIRHSNRSHFIFVSFILFISSRIHSTLNKNVRRGAGVEALAGFLM